MRAWVEAILKILCFALFLVIAYFSSFILSDIIMSILGYFK